MLNCQWHQPLLLSASVSSSTCVRMYIHINSHMVAYKPHHISSAIVLHCSIPSSSSSHTVHYTNSTQYAQYRDKLPLMSLLAWLPYDAPQVCKLCIVQHLFVTSAHAPVSTGVGASGVGDGSRTAGTKEEGSRVRRELWMIQSRDISTTHDKSKGAPIGLHFLSSSNYWVVRRHGSPKLPAPWMYILSSGILQINGSFELRRFT